WFIPEVHSEAAVRLRHDDHELLAPELLLPEVANALWQKTRRAEISREVGREALGTLLALPIRIYPSAPLVQLALEIAHEASRTVYDCLYLALALIEQCQMVTADRRFLEGCRGGSLAAHVVWVEDTPGIEA